MKTKFVEKAPGLFDKDFRAELKRLAQAPQATVDSIRKWLSTVSDPSDLVTERTWIPLARETNETIDDLRDLLRPVSYVARVGAREEIELVDALDDLVEGGVVTESDHGTGFRDRLLSLVQPLHAIVAARLSTSHPRVPLLKIEKLRTRCILVSTFDREFDIDKDSFDDYQPTLKRLHPVTTLEMEFWDDAHDNIGIALSGEDLDILLKWLTFAKIQTQKAEEAIPKALRVPAAKGEPS